MPVADEDAEAVAKARAKAKAKAEAKRPPEPYNKDEISRKVLKKDMEVAADGAKIITGGDIELQSDLVRPRRLHEHFAEHGYVHLLRADLFNSTILSLSFSLFQEQGIAADVSHRHLLGSLHTLEQCRSCRGALLEIFRSDRDSLPM